MCIWGRQKKKRKNDEEDERKKERKEKKKTKWKRKSSLNGVEGEEKVVQGAGLGAPKKEGCRGVARSFQCSPSP